MDTIQLCKAIKAVAHTHPDIVVVLADDIAKNSIGNARMHDAARDAHQAIIDLLGGGGNTPPHDRLQAISSRLADALRVSEFNR